MQRLFALAAAGLLFFGLSSIAAAAPVAVTYGFGPGVGTASTTPNANGTAGSGMGGGLMTVVYSSGSPTIGGSLGTGGVVQSLGVTFTTPGTLFAQPIPGFIAGVGAPGVRTVGGVGNFAGATAIAANQFGAGAPPFSMVGNANIGFVPLGPITILLNAAGVQAFPALPGISLAWTATGIVGAEIGRTVVPEPATGVLLLGGFAALAYGARRLRS